jgi:CHAT domain-containing protein
VYELLSEIWQRCQAVPEQRRLKWTVKTLTTVFRLLERRLKQGALMRLVGHVHDLAGPEWQHLAETATGNVVHVRLLYGTSIMVASVSVGGHTKEWPSFMAFLPLGQLSHAVRKFSDSHWPARMLSAGVYELLLRLRSVQPMKELRPLLCRFYDLLLRRLLEHREIAPRIEALGEHPTLVVTTHGALAQIPFAALHNGAEFLAERFNVVQVAHLFEEGDLTVGHMDREALTGGEPTQQPLTFRLLADTVSLPEAHKEAEQYRRMKKRGELEVDIRDGDSLPWTEETLRWLCGGPGVALLSTHLRVSNGGPGEAAIQMPQSSELALGSILRERMHADLLVLSGCVSMAKTDWFAPDEDSLVSRFRNAGAKAVVATLWRVNDLSAYPYNEALVTHLNQGVSRAKAHGAAQRAVMKTPLVLDDLTPPQERLIIEHQAAAPRTQWSDRITLNHPYFWAPFVLTGAWR